MRVWKRDQEYYDMNNIHNNALNNISEFNLLHYQLNTSNRIKVLIIIIPYPIYMYKYP